MSLRKLLYLEYVFAFLLCLYIYWYLEFPLLAFFLFLLSPDLTMLGYLVNSKIGALCYNIGHSLVIPAIVLFISFTFNSHTLLLVSLIWLAHICLDRAFGFGLKYNDSFKITHLQKIT